MKKTKKPGKMLKKLSILPGSRSIIGKSSSTYPEQWEGLINPSDLNEVSEKERSKLLVD